MCGIAGLAKKGAGKMHTEEVLARMRHRGPDGTGIYQREDIILLHTRLAIQDLSAAAAQPMLDAHQRYVLCYNGEIYNHLELRNLLPKISFRTHSDTETLLQLLIHQGPGCIDKLNGIFAFAFYDTQSQTLLLARDRFGVKPLYYTCSDTGISFASEIKTLRELNTETTFSLNPDALLQSLLLQHHLPEQTAFKEVHKLAAGTAILYDLQNKKQISPLYTTSSFIDGHYDQHTEADWIIHLEQELYAAVKRQLLSDKEIAFFLSGGIDSSLLVAIAAKIRKSPLHTYTMRTGKAFAREGFTEDWGFASSFAKAAGHHLHVLDAQGNLLDSLDDTICTLEEIQADPAAMFVGHIAAEARNRGHEVLMGGAGADDIFSGYRRHIAMTHLHTIDHIPAWILQLAKWGSRHLPGATSRRIHKFAEWASRSKEDRMTHAFLWTNTEDVLTLFRDDFRECIDFACVQNYFNQSLNSLGPGVAPLDQLLHLEQQSFLAHNLNYLDKMGMAHGVEIRVPYLDHSLARFAASIPPHLKIKGRKTKYLLRKVAEKQLPDSIIRRSKTGFGAPLREWLQHDVQFQQQLAERLSALSSTHPEIFNPKAIERLYAQSRRKEKDGVYTLFALTCIESWLRQFMTN